MLWGCASKTSVVDDVVGFSEAETKKSKLGSDVSPFTISYPDQTWIPIEAPLLSSSLIVSASIKGQHFRAILDTGAGLTLVPFELIGPLGLKDIKGRQIQIVDSQGNTLPVIHIDRPLSISIGSRVIKSRQVHIALSQTPNPHESIVLIGADVLSQVDLLIDPEAGVVGLFDAGTAPREKSDLVVSTIGEDLQMRTIATTQGLRGPMRFEMVVDTGSGGSGIPSALAKQKEVPLDLRFQDTQYSLVGSQTRQGRFALKTLELGPEHIAFANVLALQNDAQDYGLLGNDIMLRSALVVSFARRQIFLKPPHLYSSSRKSGPNNQLCEKNCISTALKKSDDEAALCLSVDVDPVYRGETLELALSFLNVDEHLARATLHAYVTVGPKGANTCIALWSELKEMGISEQTPLSLRGVRAESIQWPCDPMATECVTYSGAMIARDLDIK